MMSVGVCVMIFPCCSHIEVALKDHSGKGLETHYDDSVDSIG